MNDQGVGASVRRKEDFRFLTGAGDYTDEINRRGQLTEALGVPIEMVDVVHGVTGKMPFGMGTSASRSLTVGGSALVKAVGQVVNKGKKIAARAGCPRKPLPPRRRRNPPASIRGSRDCDSP
jgi:CO/xanthine dehydrogenase Mo-binding subunit